MINLTAALDKGLRKHNKKHNWPDDKLHASDTGVFLEGSDGKCTRQLWLRLNGAEKARVSSGTLLKYKQGDNLEEVALEMLRLGLPDNYHIVAEQINISNGLPDEMTGRLDFLLTDDENYSIIDIKSNRGNAFNYMGNSIKPLYKSQVNTYIYAIEKMFSIDVKSGAAFVLDREGTNFAREFWYQHTPEDLYQTVNAIDFIQEVATFANPPAKMKPDYKINENKGDDSVAIKLPWQCSYCDYYGVSCKGAIPSKYEIGNKYKVVGHIRDGEFDEKYTGIGKYIKEEL